MGIIANLEDSIPLLGIELWEIMAAAITVIVGIIAVIIIGSLVKRSLVTAGTSEVLADFMARVLRIVAYVFVFGLAMGFLGLNVGAALISLSVVLGFVIGFALKDSMGNVAAGFMIALTEPFEVGDYIEIGGHSGTVHHVGIATTVIDTPDNRRVIIPNGAVWGSPVINFTSHDTRRVEIPVTLAYGSDLDRSTGIALEVVAAHERVLAEPAPTVIVHSLGDSGISISVRPWTKTADYWDVRDELSRAIKERFAKEGITFAYPQMEVHLHKED